MTAALRPLLDVPPSAAWATAGPAPDALGADLLATADVACVEDGAGVHRYPRAPLRTRSLPVPDAPAPRLAAGQPATA
jgi:hypothetical protein